MSSSPKAILGQLGWKQEMEKHSRRYDANKVRELEKVFVHCQNPDEAQRLELSKKLSLKPDQVKYWFQNRRTQMRVQQERINRTILLEENQRLQWEKLALLNTQNLLCKTCGGLSVEEIAQNIYQLQLENASLKEEIERVKAIASERIGRAVVGQPITQPISSVVCSVDQGMAGLGNHPLHRSSQQMIFETNPALNFAVWNKRVDPYGSSSGSSLDQDLPWRCSKYT